MKKQAQGGKGAAEATWETGLLPLPGSVPPQAHLASQGWGPSSHRVLSGAQSGPLFLICLCLGKKEFVANLKNLLDVLTTKNKEVFLNS